MVKTYTDGIITSTVTTTVNTYDVHNQLIQTETGDGTVTANIYNGEGYRTGKEVNGEQTYYLYEADKIILEVDEAGNQAARNVYGTNLLLRTVDGETYYYLYNGHADVTALLTGDGTIAATYYYDAFGNIMESTGDVNNNIRYAGYQYDEETGLYYLNARMYDPKIARFLQEDTYRGNPKDPLSLNLYTYCTNNPVIYWDPTGHEQVPIGHVYIIRGYKDGQEVIYVGSTAQELRKRMSKHTWKTLIEKADTKVFTSEVYADLNIKASGRKTYFSARNEALRSAEQSVYDTIKKEVRLNPTNKEILNRCRYT